MIEPELLERRFGAEAVTAALSLSRLYSEPPSLDAASRLVAGIVEAPGERRISAPLRVVVRAREDDVLDVSCACKHPRICDHVLWLLVDVAFHPGLRAALLAGQPTEALARELPEVRSLALEERTLDERLSAWLPPRRFDDELEVGIEVVSIASVVTAGERPALLVRHRRPSTRSLVSAREVLAARLTPRHRRLVELTAPYHLDKAALVATRGQASLLVHLLRDEIGVHTNAFRAKVRFGRARVSPRIERDGERLVPRWYSADGSPIGDAGETFLFAGPFPYLWSPTTMMFHEVDPSVDLDAAMGMQRVPSLPLEGASAGRVGRALLLRGRGLGVALPAPDVFGLPPLERPTFELRLGGSPLDVQASLLAVYQAGKVAPGDGQGPATRDLEAEEQALSLVRAAGFDGGAEGLVAREDSAVALWQTGLATLRASRAPRFQVLTAESLARTRIAEPVAVDIKVSASAGWLDAELEFRVEALKVEIARMHEALAKGRRWVILSDGSLARIAEEIASLLGQAGMESGSARLPPHQLGRVARWTELADADPERRVRVEIDERAQALRARLGDLRERLPTQLLAALRPYQRAGVGWLQLLQELGAGGLLADDMGLGKTLMTLAFLERWREDEGARPSLVVCPTSVAGNWMREAERFTPGLRAVLWAGPERSRIALEEHDLFVTTYGLLRRDVDRLERTRFRCVVLDEAQNIKNPASETARAARRLDARMRLALTGTPVENRLEELWSLMTFVNPGMLGTAADFERRYERPIAMRPDGEVAHELRGVVRPFILRRTKREVLVDLPPKIEVLRACVFGLRQKQLYDALALAVREAVGKNLEKRGDARTHLSVLTAILRLRQMACDPRLVDPEVPAADSAKRAVFLDLVRELVSEDRRALVFSQFVELLTLWRQDLDRARVAYEVLDGSTVDRDAVVDRFQRGSAPLFLISLKAGGAGLNLTAADTVIHCDPWWNPAAEDQATDRAHRIGQSRPVTVVRLVAEGTIEDKMALLKLKKQELASAIVGGDASALGGLTEAELRLLLGGVDGDPDEEEPEPLEPATSTR